MKSLAAFQQTRREVEDLAQEFGGVFQEPTPGFIYEYEGEAGYIEKHGADQVFLCLGNWDWLEPMEKIAELEAHLFDWLFPNEQRSEDCDGSLDWNEKARREQP